MKKVDGILAYFDELQAELGDAFRQYDNIFKSQEDIEKDLVAIKEKLALGGQLVLCRVPILPLESAEGLSADQS